MLAAPGHKGLHGVQGTGFLVARKDLQLQPLLMGGTGTASNSTFQPTEPPEAYEAGTLFAGGIAALHAGAKWSFQNRERSAFNIARLADELIEYLRVLGAEIYTKDGSMGVVSFNLKTRTVRLSQTCCRSAILRFVRDFIAHRLLTVISKRKTAER